MKLSQMNGKHQDAVLIFDNGGTTQATSKVVKDAISERIAIVEELTNTSFLWSIKKLKRFIDDAIPDEEGATIKKQGVDALKLFMISMRYIEVKRHDEKEAIEAEMIEIRERVEDARNKQPNRVLTYTTVEQPNE